MYGVRNRAVDEPYSVRTTACIIKAADKIHRLTFHETFLGGLVIKVHTLLITDYIYHQLRLMVFFVGVIRL